jgi:hypothetical protein
VISVEPRGVQVIKMVVLRQLLWGKVVVIINDRFLCGKLVVEVAGGL